MASNDYLIRTVFDLVGMLSKDEILVPYDYRDRVILCKRALQNDLSGLVNSTLDLAIKSACVKYTVETTNPVLTELLNNWLENLNESFVGQIPVGNYSLAKEYFRERWKGSSMCLLRTLWEKTADDYVLPTRLWFVDGEDIVVKDQSDSAAKMLGSFSYYLRIGNTNNRDDLIPIVNDDQHYFFVQKPFCSWTTQYANPFLVDRGIYENLEFLRLLIKRGEKTANRALEYLFIIKKGTEQLALKGTSDTIYDEKDLKEIKQRFKDLVDEERTKRGVPIHATNFDTDVSDYIPDFSKVLGPEIYIPIEKRIMNSLGIIEFIPTIQIQQRTAILNPAPFIAEVMQGIEDYKTLLNDILRVVITKNRNRSKYNGQILKINSSTVTQFITSDILDHLRSAYDRGVLSKQTYTEMMGEDYSVQRNRRIHEEKAGDEETMYPPPTQNVEGLGQDVGTPGKKATPLPNTKVPADNMPADKKGPEAKNFKNASADMLKCPSCGYEFEKPQIAAHVGMITKCPSCTQEVKY